MVEPVDQTTMKWALWFRRESGTRRKIDPVHTIVTRPASPGHGVVVTFSGMGHRCQEGT
jgi:hypothetical protein